MLIESRPLKLKDKNPTIFYGTSDLEIGGFQNQDKIYVDIERETWALIQIYFHEMGHVIGECISYKNGVLTPADCKKAYIELSPYEERMIKQKFLSTPIESTRRRIFAICDEIIRVFTKNKFDPSSVELLELTRDEIKSEWIIRNNAVGNNGVVYPNSREYRNLELNAILVEAGCITILENSLPDLGKQFIISSDSHAHQRAINVISRAYTYDTTVVPSTFDQLSEPA